MQREPPPFVWAVPDEKNILTCESSRVSYAVCAYSIHRELHHRMCLLLFRRRPSFTDDY